METVFRNANDSFATFRPAQFLRFVLGRATRNCDLLQKDSVRLYLLLFGPLLIPFYSFEFSLFILLFIRLSVCIFLYVTTG